MQVEEGRTNKSTIVTSMMLRGDAAPVGDEYLDLVRSIEQELSHKICGSPRRNRLKPEVNGFPCERTPMPNGKCHKHGGKSPKAGPEHPAFRHGKYSSVLKGTSLNDDYIRMRENEDLISLSDDIAIIAVKLRGTLAKLNQGGGTGRDIWATGLYQLTQLQDLMKGRQTPEKLKDARSLIKHLKHTFNHGLNDHNVWSEWFSGVEQLRKLVDTERKHRESQSLNMSVERAMTMLSIWSEAAKNVLSPEDAKVLRGEIARLRGVNGEAPSALLPSGRDVTVDE